MFRKFALSLVAFLALLGSITSFSAPAAAYDRTQGGVIPCSADDYRFVQGRGWVSNCRGKRAAAARTPRRHGNVRQQRGYNRAATTNRSYGSTTTARSFRNLTVRKTGSFRVLTGQTVERCMHNVRTGEIRC